MTEKEIRVLKIERVDDGPLLLAQLERRQVAKVLDQHYLTHGHGAGALSFGEVAVVWLSFILWQADHRLNPVEPWAAERQQTLPACLGQPVRALDFSDNRLADRLTRLAWTELWSAAESELNQPLLRVYPRRATWVRIDTTTAETYAGASPDGRFQFGQSQSQRADLAQVKIALSALDPLGLPLVTTVVSGNRADDPLSVPEIKRVQPCLGSGGKVYVGDAKMAALAPRAYVASCGDYYRCSWRGAQLQALPLEPMLEPVSRGAPELTEVRSADGSEVVAVGFEMTERRRASVDGRQIEWTERRLVGRSLQHAAAEAEPLDRRLAKAEAALERLNQRKRGQRRLRATEWRAAAQRIGQQHEVAGLLRYRGPRPRAKARRAAADQARLQWWRDRAAIERAKERRGWRP